MIKIIIKFLIYSNIWVSFNAACFTAATFELFDKEINITYVCFSFFSTLLAYNFQRIIKFSKQDSYSERSHWLSHNQTSLFVLSGIGLIGSGIGLFFLPISIWKLFAIPAIFSVFYVIPFGYKKLPLRDLPYLKIYLIAFSWIFIAVIIPIVLLEISFATSWLIILHQFLFVIALTIPFDIRDMNIDAKVKKTIPQIHGLRKAIFLSIFLLAIGFFIIYIFQDYQFVSLNKIYSLAISSLLTGFIITKTNEKRGELFYTGILEGFFTVQFIFVLLF